MKQIWEKMGCLKLDLEPFSILLCDVNFTRTFKWTGFAEETFLEFTSVLNLMFSLSQILLVFSSDNNNKL